MARALRVLWQRYWPVDLLAVAMLVVVVVLAGYLSHRQDVAGQRNERQRQAICAILANIHSTRPIPSIRDARAVFAPAGQPHACDALPTRSPSPTPRPAGAPTSVPASPQAVILPAPSQRPSSQPPAHPTHHPSPTRTPRPTRSPSPTPSPSPTRTCLLGLICRLT